MTTQFIGVKEFRQNLASYYKKAKRKSIRYIVLNKNKPIFEVKPMSQKDVVLEELLSDVASARQEVKQGRVESLETVMKEFNIT